MTTVTISRQLGSLGSQIAFEAAQRLGVRLVWRELINRAAREAGAPEAALAAIDDLGLLGISPTPKANLAYRQAVEALMIELCAEGGVVILGRAGQVILRGRPDVLHVRIIAPEALRAQRLVERTGVDADSALAQVQASDRNRRSYLRKYYGARWDDPLLYHLTITTEHLTVIQAADLIAVAARNLTLGT